MTEGARASRNAMKPQIQGAFWRSETPNPVRRAGRLADIGQRPADIRRRRAGRLADIGQRPADIRRRRAASGDVGQGSAGVNISRLLSAAVTLAISLQVSDTIRMGDQRLRPEADRILVAQLTGEARHRARWRPLTGEEEAAALAELRALADGRADLLAQVAGIFEGTSEGEPDEPLARSAARLCRLAGADADAIPAWIEEGRRRSANARRPPFSG